jgi:hypothetical protein
MNKSQAISTDKRLKSHFRALTPAAGKTSSRQILQGAATSNIARQMGMAGGAGDPGLQAPRIGVHNPGSVQRAVLYKMLQRSVGNARLGRMAKPTGQRQQRQTKAPVSSTGVTGVQAKRGRLRVQRASANCEEERSGARVTLGAQHDVYEREADRVAASVMRMPEPGSETVQRVCSECEHTKHEHGGAPGIRRQAARSHSPEIGSDTEHEIDRMRGGGQPLAPSMRRFMEPRFGADFSGVRIHAGPDAMRTAHALNARAYTVGRDVMFGAGQYVPDTTEGRKLLAHELVHTVQQRNGGGATRSGLSVSHSDTEGIATDGATIMTVFRQTTSSPGMPGGSDPCLDLIEAIIALLEEVAQRFNDALNDPHDLFKYHRRTQDAHPDYGSWDGHKDRYYYDRDRLRQKIAEWDSNDDCRGYRLSDRQQEDLKEAEEFKEKEFPDRPAPAMREASDAEPSTREKMANALQRAGVPPWAVAGLIVVIIAALADPEPFTKVALLIGSAAAILLFVLIGRQNDVPAAATASAAGTPVDQSGESAAV